MKLLTNTEGMTPAPLLYQNVGEMLKRASITLYKRNLRDQLFTPTGYTLRSGRVEYWFNAKDYANAVSKLRQAYGRKP